ncbi:MAG: PmoA family protein [Ferruginibacter sp.]|nr:PmoA family protein [Cytophagales bacterium]
MQALVTSFSWKVIGTLTAIGLASVLAGSLPNKNFSQSERIRLTHREKEKRVDVTIDGKPFTAYLYPESIKKPVLFPLRAASGTPITRGFPLEPRPGERVDHPHHVGLWFNYGDVNGLDFWNNSDSIKSEERQKYGTIRHRRVNKLTNGNEQGTLEVTMEWVTPEGKALLREDTRFVFRGGTSRTVDRFTTLTALDQEVSFKDNKEGLIGLRVARQLEQPADKPDLFTDASGKITPVPVLNNEGVSGLYRSSEGLEGDKVWGTRAKWTSLSGQIGSESITVAIFDHPQNVGYPTYWHARGYGLFAANGLGQKAMSGGKEELDFKLAAGKSVTFRHRVVIRSGRGPTVPEMDAEAGKFAGLK